MTIENEGQTASPVHVHVDEKTPVHVHVKKPKRGQVSMPRVETARLAEAKRRHVATFGSNAKRTGASAKARNEGKGTWVPPPGKSSKGPGGWQNESKGAASADTIVYGEPEFPQFDGASGGQYGGGPSNNRQYGASGSMQFDSTGGASNGQYGGPGQTQYAESVNVELGPTHKLEMGQGGEADGQPIEISELTGEEDERVVSASQKYEEKLGSLMDEVGSLKNEGQDEQNAQANAMPQDDDDTGSRGSSNEDFNQRRVSPRIDKVELERAKRDSLRKEKLLEASRKVMEEQEAELDAYKQELAVMGGDSRALLSAMEQEGITPQSKEELMKKLVEVEMDGQSAAKHVSALRDTMRRLSRDKIVSEEVTSVNRQKQILLERLCDFEHSNRTLRTMLRDQHGRESSGVRLCEQRDMLLAKLSDTDAVVSRLKAELMDKTRRISDMKLQMEAQRDEACSMANLQSTLENTRGHLQGQLRQKEADCNRMAVQIRSLEGSLAQEKIDSDHLQQLLITAREKAERDKEALKKATRIQKQRAARTEEAVEKINKELLAAQKRIHETEEDLTEMKLKAEKVGRERNQAEEDATKLRRKIGELECLMEKQEETTRTQIENATAKLHQKSSEAASIKLENERLRSTISSVEEKLSMADKEVGQLKGNLKQYELMIDEYRSQINKVRGEADEALAAVEQQKLQTLSAERDGKSEVDKVKMKLQSRLTELEPLPDMLRSAEMRLQDASEQIAQHEKRNNDNTKLIAELTSKLEQQNEDLDLMRCRIHESMDDNRTLTAKLDNLERKMKDIQEQNRELLNTISKREDALHQTNLRLEEKSRENASLNRQLESCLADARKQIQELKDQACSKERAMQSRVVDLEATLSNARAEIARVKREKEESERKFNSRLYDLKDRLEQSHSTNRSMQNYVQFLKNSYANVFGDASMSGSPLRT